MQNPSVKPHMSSLLMPSDANYGKVQGEKGWRKRRCEMPERKGTCVLRNGPAPAFPSSAPYL